MNSILKSGLLALAVASACTAAQADTFNLSGTFGTNTYTGPLNGGTYSGTFDFNGTSVSNFDISLRDASGTVLAQLSSALGGKSAANANPADASFFELGFYSDAARTNRMELNFLAPFNGVGAVQRGSGNYLSFASVGGFTASTVSLVADGMSVAAPVPEPATYGLMGLGLLAVGVVARRRKSA